MEVVELHLCRRYSQVYDENYIITVDVATAAATAAEFQHQMMNRFKFMEEQQVFINIYWPGYTEMCTKINLLNC